MMDDPPSPASFPERRLILLRHARASDDPGGSDYARPLTPRGQREAAEIGERLVALGWTPELVHSSDSERTFQTWCFLRGRFGEAVREAAFSRRLYLSGLTEIRDCADQWPADVRTVLLIGHNPGWESALQQLAGGNEGMGTATAACLTGRGDDWPSALRGPWRLERMLSPEG